MTTGAVDLGRPLFERLPTDDQSLVNAGDPKSGRAFGDVLAAAVDGAEGAVLRADGFASVVAAGGNAVAEAAVARAKADVLLEIVSVAASRISGALNSLLQTQV